MIVAELMSKNVASVHPDTTLVEAVRIMLAEHFSGLPVVDKAGRLVGILTEGDLLRRTELGTDEKEVGWFITFLMPNRLADDYVHTHGRRVSEVMTPDPISVTPGTDLAEVAEIMRHKHVKRLPVLENGVLAGVISRSDLLRALAHKLIEMPGGNATDESIETYIIGELAHEIWAPKSGIHVKVTNHVVNLKGIVFSDKERQGVKVIAENAPGVTEVNDEMVFIDPGSRMAFPGPG